MAINEYFPKGLGGLRFRFSRRGAHSQAPLAAGFLILLIIGVASIWLSSVNRQQADLVTHSMQVQACATRLMMLIEDAEAGERGYLITRDPNFLEPYDIGVREAPRAIDRLAALTPDNPRQHESMVALKSLVAAKLSEGRRTVAAARDRGDFAAAMAIVRAGHGHVLMEQIRDRIRVVQAEERRLLAVRQRAMTATGRALMAVSLGGLAAVVALAFAATRSFERARRLLEKSESDLKAANEGLEELVAQRTAELRESNSDIRRFAHVVSHDLRTPLVNVMGFAGELEAVRHDVAAMLKDGSDTLRILSDFDEALGYIKTSAGKMDAMIGAILKVSREGKRAFRPEPLDVKALIEVVAATQHHQAQELGAEVRVGDLPPVTADRLALEQIFGNLLANALKYLDPARPGRVEVTGERAGRMNVYRVADNGRGIAKADFERVFDMFRRAGPQDRPGEGIGLTHVKVLLRSLGGRIELASTLGVGTTFTIFLPASPVSEARLAAAE
jgi:signal transduction histidine kinase